MIIHNVRLGFATNSSSTHSMIFIKGAKDKDCISEYDDADYDFGWQKFVAVSMEAKASYFAYLVEVSLCRVSNQETANIISAELLGCKTSKLKSGYIDHQSVYNLPTSWDGKGLNLEFAKEFKEFLMQDDLVILGGNDNNSSKHPLSNGNHFILDMPMDSSNSPVARKDPQGFWTLFNRETGAKVRFTFPKNGVQVGKGKISERKVGSVAPTKGYAPELIDVKITDFCPHNCSFCYQNSGLLGKHCDHDLYLFTNMLQELKVFEVAIGGGEPTSHPYFVHILEQFRSHGVVPSFSTKDISWLKDPIKYIPILKNIGAFAYSTQHSFDVENFAAILKAYGFRNSSFEYHIRNPTIHYVMGSNHYDFEHILETCAFNRIHVVLLGYKNKGRGKDKKPNDYSDWVQTVKKLHEEGNCPQLSVDTSLVKEYSKEIKEAEIPEWLFETREGAFSMYVDLVEGKMGPSSFCDESQMVEMVGNNVEAMKVQLLEAFASW